MDDMLAMLNIMSIPTSYSTYLGYESFIVYLVNVFLIYDEVSFDSLALPQSRDWELKLITCLPYYQITAEKLIQSNYTCEISANIHVFRNLFSTFAA